MPAPLNPKLQFELDWDHNRLYRDQPAGRKRLLKKPVPPGPSASSEERAAYEAEADAFDKSALFIIAARTRQQLVEQRLDPTIGLIWRGGVVGRYPVPAFQEVGLRSQEPLNHIQRRFVQLTPRARNGKENGLQVGFGKGPQFTVDSKLLGLDEPYITLNSIMRGGWRIDTDKSWQSWAALRHDLENLVSSYKLPCLPHAIVAHENTSTGYIENPHVWFILPYGSSVWWNPEDDRCNAKIMAFYSAVVLGSTSALIPLGADLSAISQPLKGKNPLSPFWSARFFNQDRFPTLTEWSEYVDTHLHAGHVARAAASHKLTAPIAESNTAFEIVQQIVFAELTAMHLCDDPQYQAALLDKAALETLVLERCHDAIVHATNDPKERRKLFAIFKSVVTPYAVCNWDPERYRPRTDRGACCDQTPGLSIKERQSVGGRYAGSKNADRCRRAVASAIREMIAAGETVSKASVARRLGFSRSTVAKRWPPQ